MNNALEPDVALLVSRDPRAFETLAAAHRAELERHCYRMTGSLQDAEDFVQETFLRAWQRLDTFRYPFSFRAWLYKIATHVCLDALAKRPRRRLPSLVSLPSDPREPFAAPLNEDALLWLEPLPEELIADAESNPEARYSERESISLAFLAALQTLPPRQRAVLLLCDVLEWHARDAAQLLDLSVPAVNSALHRARTKMSAQYDREAWQSMPVSPRDENMRSLLERYILAWENNDMATLLALLKDEATVSMPPSPSWYQGRDAIGEFMRRTFFDGAARGRWKMVATRANGQPAAGLYVCDEVSGAYHPFSLHVIFREQGQVIQVISFIHPQLFDRFGLPPQLPAAEGVV